MVLRRKQARGRPPKNQSSESPPPRRAKAIANAHIAALMMDNEGPSAKIPKLEMNGTLKEEEPSSAKVKDEPGARTSADNPDTCAICLGQRVDPTELENCIHSFCFTCTSQWFKYSEKCPLCMKPTKTFYHKPADSDEKEAVSVSELHTAAEAARLAERGLSQPPLDEHECIRLRIRRLQRRLSLLQAEMSKDNREERKNEFRAANTRLVNEISRLEMLRRDATTRADLVGNVVFRSLIYKDNLDWSSIDRNANRVAFSPAVFRENVTDATNRLHAFLDRELPIVWRSRKPRESRDQYYKHRDVVIQDIISWCGQYQINSPHFSRNLRTAGIYPGYLQRFQSELFEFASSMLSLRDFDSTSTYSSAEVRRMLERRNRREGNADEIVTVSDSDDTDNAIIPLENVRNHQGRRRNRSDDDVVVLSDDNLSRSPAGESNYIRDDPTSSNSEASNSGDFYTRPACRLPRFRNSAQRHPLRAIDAFGVLREIYTGLPSSSSHFLDSSSSRFLDMHAEMMANDLPYLFPRMNIQERQQTRRSRSRSPIGAVDNTIILSSEDEGSDDVRRNPRRRTRNATSQRSRWETSSSSQDADLANGISWLNPADSHSFVPSSHHSGCYTAVTETAPTYSSVTQGQSSQYLANSLPNSSTQSQPYPSSNSSGLDLYDRQSSLTPGSSPGVIKYVASTSTAQQNDGNNTEAGASQGGEAAKKRPKSLFHPDPGKIFVPEDEVKISDENKLLAKLARERLLRRSQGSSQGSSQSTRCGSECSMDTSTRNEVNHIDTASANSATAQSADQPGSKTSAENDDAPIAEVVVASPSPILIEEDAPDGERKSEKDEKNSEKKSASKKHKKMSWKSLFKKFRRKLKREKNTKKRKRAYEFIMDMKQKLEKDLPKNYRDEDRNSDDRGGRSRTNSYSAKRQKLDGKPFRRRSSSDSAVLERKDDKFEYPKQSDSSDKPSSHQHRRDEGTEQKDRMSSSSASVKSRRRSNSEHLSTNPLSPSVLSSSRSRTSSWSHKSSKR